MGKDSCRSSWNQALVLAMIPASAAHTLPHYVSTAPDGTPRYGCQYLRIAPTDYPGGYVLGGEIDPPPQDFNPRPTHSPRNPYRNTNNNTGGARPLVRGLTDDRT